MQGRWVAATQTLEWDGFLSGLRDFQLTQAWAQVFWPINLYTGNMQSIVFPVLPLQSNDHVFKHPRVTYVYQNILCHVAFYKLPSNSYDLKKNMEAIFNTIGSYE